MRMGVSDWAEAVGQMIRGVSSAVYELLSYAHCMGYGMYAEDKD